MKTLPDGWQRALQEELSAPYFQALQQFVEDERRAHSVFPPAEDVFAALAMTPYDAVRVLILGQDPYHDDGQAHGLSFSVRPGVKTPPSLKNIFKELAADLGIETPRGGCLEGWARQGVLLLNTVLTVRAHSANSHRRKGWETFTDAVIRAVNDRRPPVVFVLWGGPAQKKEKLIDAGRHVVLKAAHPSPLSAHVGFFGSRPFSAINAALRDQGEKEIDWRAVT
ncbi:MAG: uracil-DNA glycosylase [Myxococcaceae bacterium]